MDSRLQEQAQSIGILCPTRRLAPQQLPANKVLVQADGKDVVKRSTLRKGRYLLNLNCQLASLAAGRLGTLAQLDTKTPVLYIDFPEGRLKFFGTLVFPKNKYLVLKFGQKEVLAEDVLENMVVFTDAWWVGSAEDNPEEHRQHIPQSVLDTPVQTAPGRSPTAGLVSQSEARQSILRTSKRPRRSMVSTDSAGSSEAEDDTCEGTSSRLPMSEGRPVRAARAVAAKRLRDASDSSDTDATSND